MTVAELIAELQKLNPSMEVWAYLGNDNLAAVGRVDVEPFSGYGPEVVMVGRAIP